MSSMRTSLAVVLALASLAAGAGATALLMKRGGSATGEPATAAPAGEAKTKAARYRCPMHPGMTSDHPGECPICQMRMVPIEETGPHGGAAGTGGEAGHEGHAAAPPAAGPSKRIVYRSTMNPSETSPTPGKDSMGMEMVPVEIEEPPAGAAAVAGRAAIRISQQKQQLIGVRTAPVERRALTRTIRAVARVAYDETRLHHVHTKVGGWIERLDADSTGMLVRRGQPLLSIYSPELLASQQEYLLALRARDRLEKSTLPSVGQSAGDLVASARRRLRLFDLTDAQIDALEKSGEASRTTTLYALVTGHVIVKNVQQGQQIDPGTTLLDIADLSRVWVLAEVYEYELPFVRAGQRATMTLSYLPGRVLEGTVDFIYPFLSETTRTVKVRLEFPNPDLALKPEMFGDVELRSDLGEKLVVPDSAVVSSGERDIAFVDRGEGLFEPRELKLGARLPDDVEVLEGLSEGERVVVSGNFMVDSESKLKASLAAAPAGPPEHPPGHVH